MHFPADAEPSTLPLQTAPLPEGTTVRYSVSGIPPGDHALSVGIAQDGFDDLAGAPGGNAPDRHIVMTNVFRLEAKAYCGLDVTLEPVF
jgi:hypothetical protein